MSSLTIGPFVACQFDEAAALLARVGDQPAARGRIRFRSVCGQRRSSGSVCRSLRGLKLVAMQGGAWSASSIGFYSPVCQVSTAQKLRMFPSLLRGLWLRGTRDVISWLSAWSTMDHAEPRVHIGPIGVDPLAQRCDIGRRLTVTCCAAIAFYQRFDFTVAAIRPVLDVPNYFMHRRGPPGAGQANTPPKFMTVSPGRMVSDFLRRMHRPNICSESGERISE